MYYADDLKKTLDYTSIVLLMASFKIDNFRRIDKF